jgi:hypothetical protein
MSAARRLTATLLVAASLMIPVVPASSAVALDQSPASCTPGYRPCIPNKRSDVDCWGGSGNGPRYTKPYVTYRVRRGYDRYGLDADHDGWGCER